MAKVPRPPTFIDRRHSPSDGILQAIGRLAILSASIEDTLHGIIWKYLNVDEGRGSIFTGDRNLKRLGEDVIKLVKESKVPQSIIDDLADIIYCLNQSAAVRNHCVHWIWYQPDAGGKHRLVPPAYQSSKPEELYNPKDLNAIADDLLWIEARLSSHEYTIEALYQEIREYGPDQVPSPWLYVYPQPKRGP